MRGKNEAKGLYFYYNNQYSPSHRCKGELFRMDTEHDFLVEVIDADGDSPKNEESWGGDM